MVALWQWQELASIDENYHALYKYSHFTVEVYQLDSVTSDYHNIQPLNDVQVTANCDIDVTQVKKKENERKIKTF